MADWWNSLTELQHIFAFIAIPATLVLIVQTVLLFFGIGDGDDFDIDGDGIPDIETGDDGLTLFSVRGIIGMLCIAGWSGITFIDLGLSDVLSVFLSIVCGGLTLFGIAYLMKAILKLQSNGNIQLGSAVGKTGQVYIPIPANGSGRGKINLVVQDRFIEVEAVTQSSEPLKTGETVRVVSTDDMGLVMVERVMKA